MTDSERLQDNIRRKGKPLGRHIHRLEGEFFLNLSNWREYRSLYGKDENRIHLLNRTAPSFFYRMEQMIRESAVLGIARLLDPRKDVVSLCRIPTLVKQERLRLTKSLDIQAVLATTAIKCQFATEWRNRHIAHRSKALILDKTVVLPPSSRQSVEEAHIAIAAMLNEVQLAFWGVHTMWNDGLEGGNAELLLRVLSDGLRERERRRLRFQNGTYTPEDVYERQNLWELNGDA